MLLGASDVLTPRNSTYSTYVSMNCNQVYFLLFFHTALSPFSKGRIVCPLFGGSKDSIYSFPWMGEAV